MEQWKQILINPQQFHLEDLEEVRVNAMERAKAMCQESLGKGTSRGGGDEPKRQVRTSVDEQERASGAKPQLGEEVISGTTHFCMPVDMIASRFKTSVAKWQETQDSTQDAVTPIREVRACAKANQEWPRIELKDLDEALATMNEATGLGADRFGPRFIKSLPKTGRQMFVDLLNECEEKVACHCQYILPWYSCWPRR